MTIELMRELVQYAKDNNMSIIEWRVNPKYFCEVVMGVPKTSIEGQKVHGVAIGEKTVYKFSHHWYPIELHTKQGVVRWLRTGGIRVDAR